MRITTRELRHLAADVDDQHREGMRTLREELEEVHHGPTGQRLASSRRRFLRNAGLGGAALTVGSSLLPVSRFLPAAWAQDEMDDADLAAFAQSTELAAVAAYEAAAGRNLLDRPVEQVATMFAGHHEEHAAAFAGVAGDAATDEPNQKIIDEFGPKIEDAEDQAGLLEIAKSLEEAAAATYYFSLGVLQDPENALAVATILPIEAQHAVVLGQALDQELEEYVPSFENQENALDPAEYPIAAD